MHNLRIGSLQWVVGAYCSILGAVLLVAPHEFDNSIVLVFLNRSWVFGTCLLAAGIALFSAAILVPSRAATLTAHLFAGGLLLSVGIIDWRAAHWFSAVDNLIFGAGTALAGWIFIPGPAAPKARYNLVTLLLGIISAVTGLMLLLFQSRIQPSVPTEIQPYLPIFGALFVIGAWLLFFVLFPLQGAIVPTKRWPGIPWLAYLACGVIWLVFLIWVAYPSGSWTDMAFYFVIGGYLLVYPWLVTYSTFPFRTSLHARITLGLGIAVALPLIITVSWISYFEATSAKQRDLSHLERESTNLATGVSYFVELHRMEILALARLPSLAGEPQSEITVDLNSYKTTYPDMLALTLFDKNGQPYARAVNASVFPVETDPAYDQVRLTGNAFIDVLASPTNQRPVLAFGIPIIDRAGQLRQVITCYFAVDQMVENLAPQNRSDTTLRYLVDETGHAILQPASTSAFKDLSGYPLISATLGRNRTTGNLEIGQSDAALLVGYARVPGLGWYVISTQNVDAALAGLYEDRVTALGLLIACLSVAILAGWWIAGRLTEPLDSLSKAAVALSNGDPGMPLPKTRIQEIASLAQSFGTMRDRLIARTIEQARAEDELRLSKEKLEDRVSERTSELRSELTERRRIEEELRSIRNRFQLVLDNSPIMVFTTDQDLRYTWVYNPWKGFLPKDLLGHRDDEILPLDSVADMVALKQTVLANRQGARGEVTIRTGDGDFIYDMVIQPVLDTHDRVSGLSGAAMDITEQKHLESEMRHSAAHIEVQRRLIRLREQERVQIARDLHDGPLQDLIGLNFMISTAVHMADNSPLAEPLQGIYQSLQEQIEALRAFAGELRPPALAKFGLTKAITSYAETFQKKHPALQIDLDLEEDVQSIPEQTGLVLFRIFQESLNNTNRHAKANRVQVRLELQADLVTLQIEDDGVGFHMPAEWLDLAHQGHLGLIGMRERAEAAGGSLVVTTGPGAGTRIQVAVPIEASRSFPEGA